MPSHWSVASTRVFSPIVGQAYFLLGKLLFPQQAGKEIVWRVRLGGGCWEPQKSPLSWSQKVNLDLVMFSVSTHCGTVRPCKRKFCALLFSRCRVQLIMTPWTTACQVSLSSTISQSLLKLMPIESVMPSNHLILCHPILLLPSIFPSIRVFSNESALHIRWPKYWHFSFNVSPSNELLRVGFL